MDDLHVTWRSFNFPYSCLYTFLFLSLSFFVIAFLKVILQFQCFFSRFSRDRKVIIITIRPGSKNTALWEQIQTSKQAVCVDKYNSKVEEFLSSVHVCICTDNENY